MSGSRGLTLATYLLTALVASTSASPFGATSASAQTANVINDRHVCVLPRPNNNGRVLGHDSGWSYRPPGSAYTYYFFGDTFVDANGNGVYNTPGEFVTGTVAYTTDTTGGDCVDLTYKVGTNGLAKAAIPPGPASGGPADECLTWPHSAVQVHSTVYVYYTSVRKPACGDPDSPATYETVLARMTHPTDMTFERVAVIWPSTAPRSYSGPIKIGSRVYTFSSVISGANEKVYLSRVNVDQIEDPTQYRFWNGSTYGPTWTDVPIWTGSSFGAVGGTPSVAYNAALGRYLAVYSCAFTVGICGRLATTTGSDAVALTSGWGPEVLLHGCSGTAWAGCGHAAQHPELATSTSTGGRIYVTTARHDGAYGTIAERPFYRYWNNMREIDLSTTFTPPTQWVFGDVEREFSDVGGPGQQWTYQQTATGGPFTYVDAPYYIWVGPQSFVFADGAYPGTSQDATRVRWFPVSGSVELSLEARLLENCGNGVNVYVERVRGGAVSTIQSFSLLPGWTSPTRGKLLSWTFAVEADDRIAFRVASGGNATCDQTVFLASYKYLRD